MHQLLGECGDEQASVAAWQLVGWLEQCDYCVLVVFDWTNKQSRV